MHLPRTSPLPRLFRNLVLAALAASLPLQAQRPAVEAAHGIVASAHELASAAGVEILQRGGNAVDAAVATGLALAAVYPIAGNLGGGGFMLIHLQGPNGGRQVVIDYRETAPASASRDMYVGPDGKVMEGNQSSQTGWRASGVPGTVAGLALALEKYGSGRISWADACAPAQRLAERHRLSAGAASLLKGKMGAKLAGFPESKRVFQRDGAYWLAGEDWSQPDLAATFARLREKGPREFYTGETARRIAAAMAANGGTITAADLAGYRAVERTALRGRYRGHDIVTMPPPSSGGIAVLQMFGMLEMHDVAALGRTSAAKVHLFTEVMRRAFRDRAEYLGDPDFVSVPVAGLLEPAYIRGLMANYQPDRATPSEGLAPGRPAGLGGAAPARAPFVPAESLETTHYSVVDAAGNAVANTYTLNGNFGSGVTIPGTGVLMNNEMDDFTVKVGVKNMFGLLQGPANSIEPGKRPLSSMTPTLVLRDGRLLLVTGSPGGPTIINTVLQVISNVIDFRMPVAQAVEAPRIHHQWMPDVLTHEVYGMSEDTSALLKAKGHAVRGRESYEGSYQGDAETIWIDPATNLRHGAADPRKADARAVGY